MASISVAGFATCPFHQQALAAAKKLVELGIYDELDDLTCATRDEYQVWLKADKPSLEDARAATHTSSPFVFSGETFIGGCDDTLALLADSEAGRSSAPTRRLRAVASALVGSAGGAPVARERALTLLRHAVKRGVRRGEVRVRTHEPSAHAANAGPIVISFDSVVNMFHFVIVINNVIYIHFVFHFMFDFMIYCLWFKRVFNFIYHWFFWYFLDYFRHRWRCP